MPRVAVILPDLLQCAGMTAVLERYFAPVEVVCFAGVEEAVREGGCFDAYFTDSGTFAGSVDFFLPRRAQSVVLVSGDGVATEGDAPRRIATGGTLETLLDAVGRVLTAPVSGAVDGAGSDELSAREVDVLRLVVRGAINKEIADRLNISLNTVLTHRKNITAKLGIKTISGLTLYALMHGYVSAEDMVL